MKENGDLCTVARSWLLSLHDESVWKNFEWNIAWGVDEFHQTFLFEQVLEKAILWIRFCLAEDEFRYHR